MSHTILTDEDFFFSKKRSVDFCNKLIEAKTFGRLPMKFVLSCQTRVVNFLKYGKVDLDFITLVRKAGFISITIGAESCLPHVLATPLMNKNHYTKSQILDIALALHKEGITTGVNFMLLAPESTRQDMLEELSFILQLINKGIETRVSVRINAFPGAPALSNPRYSFSTRSLKSPLSGKNLVLPDTFLPISTEITNAYTNFDTYYNFEIAKMGATYEIKGAMRNSYYGLIRCLAVAKLFDFCDIYEEFNDIASKWFSENKKRAHSSPETKRLFGVHNE
jgi:radical SAM superfamily enzyme YgiQ (UPF0313 family)